MARLLLLLLLPLVRVAAPFTDPGRSIPAGQWGLAGQGGCVTVFNLFFCYVCIFFCLCVCVSAQFCHYLGWKLENGGRLTPEVFQNNFEGGACGPLRPRPLGRRSPREGLSLAATLPQSCAGFDARCPSLYSSIPP